MLSTGVFSSSFKINKVIPIQKIGDPNTLYVNRHNTCLVKLWKNTIKSIFRILCKNNLLTKNNFSLRQDFLQKIPY